MASILSTAPLGGMGGGGPLRCSFCGRRAAVVEHLVRARGVHICDRCVTQAHSALAGASPGQKVLRFRPTPARIDDRDAAEAAIEDAYETVFGGRGSIEDSCRAIEAGHNLRPAMEQAAERTATRIIDVSVDSVRFVSEDEAEVRFTLWLSGVGSEGMPRTGHAVRVGDTWKVARDTWCGLVRMIGLECPPPPD